MVALDYLMGVDGVLQIGPMTEKQFGRAHYKDLLASFSGAQLLLGRYGNVEVGYIDPSMLTGDKEGRLILLSGRSWSIGDVDWKKRLVWLEPAKEGGKARWTGSGRTLSREIAQGMFRGIHQSAGPCTIMSKRATAQIDQITEEIPDTPTGLSFSVTRKETGGARLWTFAGTCANRTTAKQIQTLVEVRRVDAVGLDLKTPIELCSLNDEQLKSKIDFSDSDLQELAKSIKFSACLPKAMIDQIVRLRQFQD
jgi:ATP-dependent Lhr-like helicase